MKVQLLVNYPLCPVGSQGKVTSIFDNPQDIRLPPIVTITFDNGVQETVLAHELRIVREGFEAVPLTGNKHAAVTIALQHYTTTLQGRLTDMKNELEDTKISRLVAEENYNILKEKLTTQMRVSQDLRDRLREWVGRAEEYRRENENFKKYNRGQFRVGNITRLSSQAPEHCD